MTQHAPKALWFLAAVNLLIAGCTGTPMPIPPSIESERLAVQEAEPEDPCPEGDCIYMIGEAGATEASSVLLAHRMRPFEPEPIPEMPMMALTHVDESGRFEVLLQGPAEGLLRVLVHGAEGTIASTLEILPGDPGTPRAVNTIGDEWPDTCLVADSTEIDFGTVLEGETETRIVQIENVCDELVFFFDHYIVGDPEPMSEWTFGVMNRAMELEPHTVTTFVVAFWPTDVAEFRAGLFITAERPEDPGFFMVSIPVRGVAVARE